MLQPISDRRESHPIETETIRQLHLQRLLHRILVNFPLPERRGKPEADKYLPR